MMNNPFLLSKIICTIIFYLFFTLNVNSQNSFHIEGKFEQCKNNNKKIFISYYRGGTQYIDSSSINNRKYSFIGKIDEPSLAKIYINTSDSIRNKEMPVFIELFLEPTLINIVHLNTFKNTIVSGSNSNIKFESILAIVDSFELKIAKLTTLCDQAIKNGDVEKIKSIENKLDTVDSLRKECAYKSFIINNPNSFVSIYAINKYFEHSSEYEKMQKLFMTMSYRIRSSIPGKHFQENIDNNKGPSIGSHFIDFQQNDTLDIPRKLSSFIGNYVLLDFWASWCMPCRKENRNLVNVYSKYKSKGFTIISVSFDQPNRRIDWVNAIKEDGLIWTNLSDLKFWNNEAGLLYKINALPSNLLFNPSGIIIAKDLRGRALDDKLQDIFGLQKRL